MTQALPPLPHDDVERATHWLPAQQLLAQDAALHTHWPPTHSCPEMQAAPPPQVQPPEAQPSAKKGSQRLQAPPPLPQVNSEAA